MKARQCGHVKAKCLDSRTCEGYRRRRYKCDACGARFSTVEVRVDGMGRRTGGPVNALDALIEDFSITRRQRRAIHELVHSFKETETDGNE